MGTSTISMAIFNSELLVYRRVARSIDLSQMIWQPGCGHGSWNLSRQEVLWSHATDPFYNVVPQLAL